MTKIPAAKFPASPGDENPIFLYEPWEYRQENSSFPNTISSFGYWEFASGHQSGYDELPVHFAPWDAYPVNYFEPFSTPTTVGVRQYLQPGNGVYLLPPTHDARSIFTTFSAFAADYEVGYGDPSGKYVAVRFVHRGELLTRSKVRVGYKLSPRYIVSGSSQVFTTPQTSGQQPSYYVWQKDASVVAAGGPCEIGEITAPEVTNTRSDLFATGANGTKAFRFMKWRIKNNSGQFVSSPPTELGIVKAQGYNLFAPSEFGLVNTATLTANNLTADQQFMGWSYCEETGRFWYEARLVVVDSGSETTLDGPVRFAEFGTQARNFPLAMQFKRGGGSMLMTAIPWWPGQHLVGNAGEIADGRWFVKALDPSQTSNQSATVPTPLGDFYVYETTDSTVLDTGVGAASVGDYYDSFSGFQAASPSRVWSVSDGNKVRDFRHISPTDFTYSSRLESRGSSLGWPGAAVTCTSSDGAVATRMLQKSTDRTPFDSEFESTGPYRPFKKVRATEGNGVYPFDAALFRVPFTQFTFSSLRSTCVVCVSPKDGERFDSLIRARLAIPPPLWIGRRSTRPTNVEPSGYVNNDWASFGGLPQKGVVGWGSFLTGVSGGSGGADFTSSVLWSGTWSGQGVPFEYQHCPELILTDGPQTSPTSIGISFPIPSNRSSWGSTLTATLNRVSLSTGLRLPMNIYEGSWSTGSASGRIQLGIGTGILTDIAEPNAPTKVFQTTGLGHYGDYLVGDENGEIDIDGLQLETLFSVWAIQQSTNQSLIFSSSLRHTVGATTGLVVALNTTQTATLPSTAANNFNPVTTLTFNY